MPSDDAFRITTSEYSTPQTQHFRAFSLYKLPPIDNPTCIVVHQIEDLSQKIAGRQANAKINRGFVNVLKLHVVITMIAQTKKGVRISKVYSWQC